MCEHDQVLDSIDNSLLLLSQAALEKRSPIDQTIMASNTQPWVVDYRNRKHIFIWFPSAQSISFDDFGTGPIQAQVWINIGMPQGTRMFITTATGPTEFMIRCTDETIP